MTEPTLPTGSSNADSATPAAPDGHVASQPPGSAASRRPLAPPPAQYKGGDLDPARGPGLGCFYVQLVLLVALLVATPLTVNAGWPPVVSMGLLIAIIILLLFTGQTMIFLLRLVAAERGRRRPLAAQSRTVGDIEADEELQAADEEQPAADEAPRAGVEAARVAGEARHRPLADGTRSSEARTPETADRAAAPPEHGGSVRE